VIRVGGKQREKVGVGCAGSLTGMCSSFAVTTFSDGYRYSHQNWCPMTVTSMALPWGGCVLDGGDYTRGGQEKTTTMRIGMTVHASSTCVLP
jgi:hypothetical protein